MTAKKKSVKHRLTLSKLQSQFIDLQIDAHEVEEVRERMMELHDELSLRVERLEMRRGRYRRKIGRFLRDIKTAFIYLFTGNFPDYDGDYE